MFNFASIVRFCVNIFILLYLAHIFLLILVFLAAVLYQLFHFIMFSYVFLTLDFFHLLIVFLFVPPVLFLIQHLIDWVIDLNSMSTCLGLFYD